MYSQTFDLKEKLSQHNVAQQHPPPYAFFFAVFTYDNLKTPS